MNTTSLLWMDSKFDSTFKQFNSGMRKEQSVSSHQIQVAKTHYTLNGWGLMLCFFTRSMAIDKTVKSVCFQSRSQGKHLLVFQSPSGDDNYGPREFRLRGSRLLFLSLPTWKGHMIPRESRLKIVAVLTPKELWLIDSDTGKKLRRRTWCATYWTSATLPLRDAIWKALFSRPQTTHASTFLQRFKNRITQKRHGKYQMLFTTNININNGIKEATWCRLIGKCKIWIFQKFLQESN